MNSKIIKCIKLANNYNLSICTSMAIVFNRIKLSEYKSLYDLWTEYGLDKSHRTDIRVEVLQQWIAILYGRNIDVNALLNEILENQTKLYLNVRVMGSHISFKDALESLLLQLDLGEYE